MYVMTLITVVTIILYNRLPVIGTGISRYHLI